MREIANGIAIAAGLPEDKMPEVIIPDEATPPNFNNPDLTDRIKNTAVEVIGTDNVKYQEPLMIGEDFSQYGATEHQVPTVLYWLGTVPDHRVESGDTPGLHSPFYYPDPEKSITTGVRLNTQILIDLFGA